MLDGKRIAVVMPAFNAAKTLERTVQEIPEIAQCIYFGCRIGEISCPTKYFDEASSINFRRSVKYGLGVVSTTLKLAGQRLGLVQSRLFSDQGRKLELSHDGNRDERRMSVGTTESNS